MADCCTPGTGFPSATSMEALATNNSVIWEEICLIQQAILAASSQCQPGGGQFCTTVGGNTPMTFVSGVSSVTVVNGGSGYYSDTPTVAFIPPIGSAGTGATGTVQTNGGNIVGIAITNGGTGYSPVPATMSVSSLTGSGAILQPLVNANGNIVNINIANAGINYTIGDTVTATRAVAPNIAYVNASFQITSVSITGQITGIAIINPGSGYQPSTAQVQIVSTLNPALPYPIGTGFMGTVNTSITGVITGVTITNTGAGYAVYPPYLVITDPGTGATTVVTLGTGLMATSVASIAVTSPGTGYTTFATGTVFNPSTAGTGNAATANAVLSGGAFIGISGLVGGGLYTSVPIVTISNSIGPGTGATATAIVSGGAVTSVSLNTGGTGYTNGVYTNVAFTGIIGAGTGALVNITVAGGIVTVIALVAGGSGYTIGTSITSLGAITPGSGYTDGTYLSVPLTGGTGSSATANITVLGGAVTAVTLVNAGAGYTISNVLSASNTHLGLLGSGFSIPVTGTGHVNILFSVLFNTLATAIAMISGGTVSGITVTNPGSGYNAATVTFSPPTNSPANPAVVTINVAQNTFGTNPYLYWQVWAGAATNAPIQAQENTVLSYFKGLGYTISIQSNPATGSTIQWKICW